MKTIHERLKRQNRDPRPSFWRRAALSATVLAACFALAGTARAQVVPAATSGEFKLSAGGTASGYYIQYGQQKLFGATAFVDADIKRGFGIEGEGRWLEWNKIYNVHVETYSVGLRYHMNFRRFQPYAKGLIGFSDFNFPLNFAQGHYQTITAGGGLDYRWTRRIRLRLADVEWQDWPQFTYGSMNSVGVSTGIRVGIF
jgi:hypothetical protein